MGAHFGLPSICTAVIDPDKKKAENSWRAPIFVKFEMSYFPISGIQVRYSKTLKRALSAISLGSMDYTNDDYQWPKVSNDFIICGAKLLE